MIKYVIKVHKKDTTIYTRGEFTSISSLNNDLQCLSITEEDTDTIIVLVYKDDKLYDCYILYPSEFIGCDDGDNILIYSKNDDGTFNFR